MTEKKEEKSNCINNLDPTVPPTLTDLDLSCSNFPEPRFIVSGLIPEGLTILAGKPKTGKSLLAYGLCTALAAGQHALGIIPVDQCETLYLALEDQESRLNAKLSKIRGNSPPTNMMHFALKWPRIDAGGLEDLAGWLQKHPTVKLVVIDTFTRFRPLKSNGTYSKDYVEISKIKKLADENSVAILLIHHLRKASAVDELDLVTGSTGLTGAADSVAIFSRKRMAPEATLLVAGRDIEESNLALSFDKSTLSWTLLGQAEGGTPD